MQGVCLKLWVHPRAAPLVKKSKDLLEYVIVHETARLLEPTRGERGKSGDDGYATKNLHDRLVPDRWWWKPGAHRTRHRVEGCPQVGGRLGVVVSSKQEKRHHANRERLN